jgi:hypothetical protein
LPNCCGEGGGRNIGELGIGIRYGIRTRGLAGTTHACPTNNDGASNASIEDVRA